MFYFRDVSIPCSARSVGLHYAAPHSRELVASCGADTVRRCEHEIADAGSSEPLSCESCGDVVQSRTDVAQPCAKDEGRIGPAEALHCGERSDVDWRLADVDHDRPWTDVGRSWSDVDAGATAVLRTMGQGPVGRRHVSTHV